MNATDDLLPAISASDGARLLGISRRLWWEWHSRGVLGPVPIVKVGRIVRWSAKELAAWVAAGQPPRERWNAVKAAGERARM